MVIRAVKWAPWISRTRNAAANKLIMNSLNRFLSRILRILTSTYTGELVWHWRIPSITHYQIASNWVPYRTSGENYCYQHFLISDIVSWDNYLSSNACWELNIGPIDPLWPNYKQIEPGGDRNWQHWWNPSVLYQQHSKLRRYDRYCLAHLFRVELLTDQPPSSNALAEMPDCEFLPFRNSDFQAEIRKCFLYKPIFKKLDYIIVNISIVFIWFSIMIDTFFSSSQLLIQI